MHANTKFCTSTQKETTAIDWQNNQIWLTTCTFNMLLACLWQRLTDWLMLKAGEKFRCLPQLPPTAKLRQIFRLRLQSNDFCWAIILYGMNPTNFAFLMWQKRLTDTNALTATNIMFGNNSQLNIHCVLLFTVSPVTHLNTGTLTQLLVRLGFHKEVQKRCFSVTISTDFNFFHRYS